VERNKAISGYLDKFCIVWEFMEFFVKLWKKMAMSINEIKNFQRCFKKYSQNFCGKISHRT